MGKDAPFGLGAATLDGELLFLPLQSVSVFSFIFDVSALVELKQQYSNPPENGRLSSARYIFPIPENAAVCAFKMKDSDGRTVRGVVKETEKAKEDFQKAVSRGKWSGLAYEITSDVSSISIGAIPPGQNVEISLSYSMDIPENESEMMNQIRFALPTFIGQRYGSVPVELSHPRSDDRGATFTFNASVRLTSKILEITSPSHTPNIIVQESRQIQGGSAPLYGSEVELRDPVRLDKDFVLSIQAEKLDMPRCIAEVNTAENSVALMLTLVPRLGAPDVGSQEYIFVVDRSGSMMNESRMEYAKDALKHLMKGLPSKNTYFNIVSFGNQVKSLWNKSVVYNRETLAASTTHINTMTANMGGTEIGKALEWVFSNRMKDKPTAVFLLTDGQIWRPEAVINPVSEKVKASGSTDFLRVFTIGIGNGASVALCSGIARVGNGVCYMTTQSEEIKDRCSKVLRAARALPYGNTSNLTIDWGYGTVPHTPSKPEAATELEQKEKKPLDFFDRSINPLERTKDVGLQFALPPHPDVLQAPTQSPNLYQGNRFLVSAILTNTLEPPAEVVLKGTLPGGEPVELSIKVAYILGDQKRLPLLHVLAAKRFIRELEDGDVSALGVSDKGDKSLCNGIIRAAVVEYGTRYSLASRFTAFVAVEKREGGEDEERGDEKKDCGDKEPMKSSEIDEDDGFVLVQVNRSSPAVSRSSAEGFVAPTAPSDKPFDQPGPGPDVRTTASRRLAMSTSRAQFIYLNPGSLGKSFLAGSSAPAPPPLMQYAPDIQLTSRSKRGPGHGAAMIDSLIAGGDVENSGSSRPSRSPPLRQPGRTMSRRTVSRLPSTPSDAITSGYPAPTVVASDDPVTPVADLQSHDGSFVLDGQLLALLRRKKGSLSLDQLEDAIPESIRRAKNAGTIWGTVLAAAYMVVALADRRSIWDSLWDKAQEFVCQQMNMAPFQFNGLVQAASARLQ